MRRTSIVFVVFFALSAVLTGASCPANAASNSSLQSQQEHRDRLIGTWFGETPPTSGGHIEWIIDRSEDGTFKVRFRIFSPDGPPREHMETGIWGVSGPVYFSATQGWRQGTVVVGTDTTRARFYDAYEILRLTDDAFEYRHYVTGTTYKVRRVGRHFKFPGS
jgi:hypothetical protein